MYFLWHILIGMVAGIVAYLTSSGPRPGIVWNLVAGAAGALLGGWLMSVIGLVPVRAVGTLITALVGAIIVLWIVLGIYSNRYKKHHQQQTVNR